MKIASFVAGLGVVALGLSGCETMKGAQQDQDQLRTQVGTLESQVASLSSQVEELKTRQQSVEDRAWDAGARVTTASATTESKTTRKGRTVLTAKEIQLALQRAGYFQGTVDGKIGAKTRSAIRAFQAANNLVADGVAGSKTMIALQAYLTQTENSQ